MSIEQIHHHLIKNNWTLALAESCTGGEIASRFVAIPDCSFYFQGGIVAYSNKSKAKILNVKQATLDTHGAVSEETAQEMANGVLDQFETHFSLATTGVAGPSGGTLQKPVGTVCFAIVSRSHDPVTWKSHFHGERGAVIEQAVIDALEHLWAYVYNLSA